MVGFIVNRPMQDGDKLQTREQMLQSVAMEGRVMSGISEEKRIWRVKCETVKGGDEWDWAEFNFVTRDQYDAFIRGKPDGITVTDIYEGYQHSADYAIEVAKAMVEGLA